MRPLLMNIKNEPDPIFPDPIFPVVAVGMVGERCRQRARARVGGSLTADHQRYASAGKMNLTPFLSVRNHVQQQKALGTSRFQAEIEALLGRRAVVRPRGRLRLEGD